MKRSELVTTAVVAIAAVGTAIWLSRQPDIAPAHQRVVRVVHVPRAIGEIKVDGDLDEPSWQTSAREKFIQQDGNEARPYSDIRLTWSGDTLHIGLYASDHDIVSAKVPADGPLWRGDTFHVVMTVGNVSYAIDVDPMCTITDSKRHGNGPWDYTWQSGAHAACDADGTVDVPGDNDEEWVVEMDVPLVAEKDGPLEIFAHRCDVAEVGGKALQTPCPQSEPVRLVLDP